MRLIYNSSGNALIRICLLTLSGWTICLKADYHTVLSAPNPQFITIEHAKGAQRQSWGLMQRSNLPASHGMLFSYEAPRHITLWAFNCLIDLQVAFLDSRGIIQEIAHLKSYPEKMDPNRPVNELNDLSKYPSTDPICHFFLQHSVKSKALCNYALEMPAPYFEDSQLKAGDVFLQDGERAFFLQALDICSYLKEPAEKLQLKLITPKPIALRTPHSGQKWIVKFYDAQGALIKRSYFLRASDQTAFCRQAVSSVKLFRSK